MSKNEFRAWTFLIVLLLAAFYAVLRVETAGGLVSTTKFFKKATTATRAFVITPAKLGWTKTNWTIRENVVFPASHWPDIPNYLGSRGFEFRYNLHPAAHWQEIHTTISVYSTAAPAWSTSGKTFIKTVDLGNGVTGTIVSSGDVDNTFVIYFTTGGYAVNIKMKFSVKSTAVPVLVKAGKIIVAELYSY